MQTQSADLKRENGTQLLPSLKVTQIRALLAQTMVVKP